MTDELRTREPLDPNTIAAYADGVLSEEDRAELEPLVARDPEAMLLVRAIRAEQRRRVVVRWTLSSAAAVVLVALGLVWMTRRDAVPVPTLEARLDAAAAALGSRHPDLFDGFAPYDGEALRAERSATRAGGAWLAPLGVVLEPPEALRWHNPPGATRAHVSITGPGTAWSRELEGERAAAPALGPGRYIVRFRALDALAGQEIRRVFVITDETEGRRHARALASIRETTPPDLAALLVAHYALRHRLMDEAREALGHVPRADEAMRRAAEALELHLEAITR